MSESIRKKLISPVKRLKEGDEKRYIILIKMPNSDETFWDFVTGRDNLYKYIKENIEIIDVEQSFIFVHGMKEINFDKLQNVYDFVIWIKQKCDIVDEFDIDDYTIYSVSENNTSNIGEGLESAGKTFTGIAGSFISNDDNDE